MKKAGIFDFLRLLYTGQCTTRAELAHEMDVATSKVCGVVAEALSRGLLVERGLAQSKRGRRRILLGINPELAQLLGIEIGRWHIRLARTDFVGKTLDYQELASATSKGKDHVLQLVHQAIKRLLLDHPEVGAIGISHSGVINPQAGKVLFWPMVDGWEDTALREIFEAEHKVPAFVEDSVRAAATVEQRLGHGRDVRDFVFVYVGMGIGSAIFVDGRVYTGHDGLAGELGHATVKDNGKLCSCGNRGCLELYCSASAMIARVRAEIKQGVASSLSSEVRENPDQLSLEKIAAAAQSHDRLAERVLTEAGAYLGTALAGMVNLLNPKRIILSGHAPRAAQEFFLGSLLYNLRHRGIAHSTRGLEVVVSQFGDEAAALGAALIAGEEVLKVRCEEIERKPSAATERLSSTNPHRVA
jgi:predicted NBD/HSP70 family sugar kinase